MTWEHAGPDGRTLPFGWHARRSLAAELDRDADELGGSPRPASTTTRTLFDEPYPFDSYDQAFVPGLNWGALETPGCVTFRDEYLPLGRVTEGERRRRAMVIAHEMAHMWFGDLVTLRWWEDTWLNESFADYMGYRVAETAAGFEGTCVDFTVGRKARRLRRRRAPLHPPGGRRRRGGAPTSTWRPANFDAISYAKGNSVLRQLVTWLGDETSWPGSTPTSTRHRFGNATLADFVDALDGGHRPRRPGVGRARGCGPPGSTRCGSAATPTGPVLTREGSRPHRVRVTSYDESLARIDSRLIDLGDEPVRLGDARSWCPTARARPSRGSASTSGRGRPSSGTSPRSPTTRHPCGPVERRLRPGAVRRAPTRWTFLGLVTRHLPARARTSASWSGS